MYEIDGVDALDRVRVLERSTNTPRNETIQNTHTHTHTHTHRLDTLMTCKQVAGPQGWTLLTRKVRLGGAHVLFQVHIYKRFFFSYEFNRNTSITDASSPPATQPNSIPRDRQGAGASFAANVVGHYPWFAVYNLCETHLPEPVDLRARLARNALMGFAGALLSGLYAWFWGVCLLGCLDVSACRVCVAIVVVVVVVPHAILKSDSRSRPFKPTSPPPKTHTHTHSELRVGRALQQPDGGEGLQAGQRRRALLSPGKYRPFTLCDTDGRTDGQTRICPPPLKLAFFSHTQTTQRIIATDGIRGLLGRGLGVRLFANGLQVSSQSLSQSVISLSLSVCVVDQLGGGAVHNAGVPPSGLPPRIHTSNPPTKPPTGHDVRRRLEVLRRLHLPRAVPRAADPPRPLLQPLAPALLLFPHVRHPGRVSSSPRGGACVCGVHTFVKKNTSTSRWFGCGQSSQSVSQQVNQLIRASSAFSSNKAERKR
jgi:hypothetical protein